MNDLKDYFKQQSRKRSRGPVKTMCTTKGPAVSIATYLLKRTVLLVIVGGSQWGTKGPAVNECGKPDNDNTPLDVA